METLIVELTNNRAYKLLRDMEELGLIKLIKKSSKISSLPGKIKARMTVEEINEQMKNLRSEWQRDF